MTPERAKAYALAKERWAFAKTFVEPHIKEACNDDSALGLLPNHQALIKCGEQAQLIVKCRKTAYSWGIALDAIARAFTEPKSTSIIISIDEKEAKEKNNFVEWIYGVLHPGLRREFRISGGSEERRFSNGSRLQFIAHKAPTGSGATIYADEFSVESRVGDSASEILTAAIGCTTHAGYIRVGGTERGPDTVFHQIRTGKVNEAIAEGAEGFEGMPTVDWDIHEFPWWCSPALCNDVADAIFRAPGMETYERVQRYGNDRLKRQYVLYLSTPELGLEVFQREFECRVLDDNEAYFPLALIESNYPKRADNYWWEKCEVEGLKYNKSPRSTMEGAKNAIVALEKEINSGRIRGDFGWAMDVGRDRDWDEIWIGHSLPEDNKFLCPRVSIGMDKMPFEGKKDIVSFIFDHLPVTKGYVDGTKGSVGVQLAEWANGKWHQRAAVFEFSQASKQIISSGMKARLEMNKIIIPKYTKLRDQMHSIKKEVTRTGNVLFDNNRANGHHADCYWAMAMFNDLYSLPAGNYAFQPPVAKREPAQSTGYAGQGSTRRRQIWVPGRL